MLLCSYLNMLASLPTTSVAASAVVTEGVDSAQAMPRCMPSQPTAPLIELNSLIEKYNLQLPAAALLLDPPRSMADILLDKLDFNAKGSMLWTHAEPLYARLDEYVDRFKAGQTHNLPVRWLFALEIETDAGLFFFRKRSDTISLI